MKTFFLSMALCSLALANTAKAEIYKGRCQIEVARSSKFISKQVELEFVNNGKFAQKKISVTGNVGNLGKITLSGQFTVAVLDSEPSLTISYELKSPQNKLSVSDVAQQNLSDRHGDVLRAGSMLTLDKDTINAGCVLSVE